MVTVPSAPVLELKESMYIVEPGDVNSVKGVDVFEIMLLALLLINVVESTITKSELPAFDITDDIVVLISVE